MPSKKKKQGSRPVMIPQDSMRRDIHAARDANLHVVSSNESGNDGDPDLDIADQLLATLDARDQAAAKMADAKKAEEGAMSPTPPHKVSSATSEGSGHGIGSPNSHHRKGPGGILMHAGEALFGHHHHSPRSPPTVSSPDDAEISESLSSDMATKGSIRQRIFGASPSKGHPGEETEEKQRKNRQKARKVSNVCCVHTRVETATNTQGEDGTDVETE
jgi:hypothetical protein